MNSKSPHEARGLWHRLAWLPIPLLLMAMAALWVADLRAVWDPWLMVLLVHYGPVFLGVAFIVIPAALGFLRNGQPSVLMLGCGILMMDIGVTVMPNAFERSSNTAFAIYNTSALLAALCHFSGVTITSQHTIRLRHTGAWLAGVYAGGAAVVGLLIWLAFTDRTPAFFIEDQGGTLLRTVVVSAAVTLFLLTAGLLLQTHRRAPSPFLFWYALGLILMAAGLAGSALIAVRNSPLQWVARLTQVCGMVYMCVAVLASARAGGAKGIPLEAVEDAWRENAFLARLRQQTLVGWALRYGLAIGAVSAGTGLRLLLTAWVGPGLATYITFYPAVMLAAVIGGLWPGILATVLTGLVAAYWILPPAGQFAIGSPADRVGLVLFAAMGLFMSVLAEFYRRNRDKAAAYDREAAISESREALRRHAELVDPVRAEIIAREMLRVVRGRGVAVGDATEATTAGKILQRVPDVAGVAVACVGFLVLMGWLFGLDALKSVLPGMATMKVNTALCLVLAGTALVLRERRGLRLVSMGVVCAIAGLSLLEYATGANLGLDSLFAYDRGDPYTVPGRMAQGTAITFLLSAAALALLRVPGRASRWAYQACALGAGAIGMVAVLGYLYREQLLTALSASSSMALPTATAFVLLAAGLMAARMDGVAGMLAMPGPGAQLARRLLPVAFVVPPLLGWLYLTGARVGYLDPTLGTGLLVLAIMLSFVGFIWWAMRALVRGDAARSEVERQLRSQSELMDHAHEALFVREVGGAIRFWNRGAEAVYGWRAAEVLGQSTHALLRTKGHPAEEVDTQLAETGHWEGELSHTTRDGKHITVESRQTATRAPDGTVLILESNRDITERKRLELELHKNLTEHQTILNSMPAMVFYKDRENHFVRTNPAFERAMGLPKEALEGKSLLDIYPREQADAYWLDDKEVMASGESKIGIVEPMPGAAGTRWLQTDKVPYVDESGNVIGVIGLALDITGRKQAEDAVRESEDRLRFALETSHTGAWDLDLVDHTAFRSLEHDRIFGYADLLPEWTYEMFLDHVLPEDRPAVDAAFQHAAATHGDWNFECRIRRVDGEVRWILAAGRHRADAAGNLRRMAGIVQDITIRKHAEEEIRANREWLRVTLTSIGDAVIAGDTQTRITFMNPVAAALTGWSEEEALGQPVWRVFNIINELTHERAEAPCSRALKEKCVVALANHTALITKDGREIPVEDSAAPIFDADGNVLGVVLVFHDVTEKRRAQEALRKAHEELEVRVKERTAELEHSMDLVRAERMRFQDVLDKLPAYLILLSADYRVPFANRFFEERFGKSNGQRCYEYLFQLAEPCENCETYKVMKTGAPHRWEWTGPDGRNYDIYDFPFTNVDGSNLIMEVGLDITERKQAEAELEKHHQHLEELVQQRTTQLEAVNQQLQSELVERQRAQEALLTSRAAALNLMEDSVDARREAEQSGAALRRSRDRSELLAETLGALLQSSEPQALVETLCARVMEHLDCHAFFNFLADAEAGRLHLNAYAGIPEEEAVKIEWLDYGVAVCGCVATECSRIVAEHIPTTQEPRTDLVRSFGVTAYACHPLLGPGNRVIGTLSFGTRSRETFSEDDLSLMRNVADYVAVAMDRVSSEHALQRAHDELEQRVADRTEELRQASSYVRNLIEASLDPLITISAEGRIMDVNSATERATGLPRSELIGSDFSDYFTEPHAARKGYRTVLARGQIRDYPLTIRNASGGTAEVLYNAVTYTNENGEVQGVFAAARDVTERNRIEEALRNSERLLAEAQRIAHLGGWDWNIVADQLSWSDEMFRLFGFEPRAFPVNYARFLESVHPEDRELVMDRVARALDRSGDYDVVYRVILPDMTERILHAQAETLFNNRGEPVHMTGTVLDITEQVHAQEEAKAREQLLLQADKMVSLGTLTSGVAHEINNPNHLIMTNLGTLSEVWEGAQPILDRFHKDFGDFVLGGYEYPECRERLMQMFSNALSGSRRIQSIVDELRTYARSSPVDSMSAVDVNAVVESSHVLLSSILKKSTNHFTRNLAARLPAVFGNAQRLEQVIINLVQNACHALDNRDKAITVSTHYAPETRSVIVEVLDQGKGIDEKDIGHLGDPFFTTRRTTGGTGLGLWVSFNIVQQHGGTLRFFSKRGEGTRAVLTLRAYQPQDSAEKLEESSQN